MLGETVGGRKVNLLAGKQQQQNLFNIIVVVIVIFLQPLFPPPSPTLPFLFSFPDLFRTYK